MPSTVNNDDAAHDKKPAAAKKSTTRKKAPAKKAATKKKAAKKNVATFKLDDPRQLRPVIYKRKFGADEGDKSKTLHKMVENVRKVIDVISERSAKRPVKVFTPAMLRSALAPYDELYFQYMLGSIGFRTPNAIEIVAQEKIGATTFVMDWIGRLLDIGCYSVYIECEGKQMENSRVQRLMDRDPKIAMLKHNSVGWTAARTLLQFEETARKTVAEFRKRCDADPTTKGNPIFVFVDPWGALMSDGEAKGNSDWGFTYTAKAEAPKDSTAGSNFEHAKHAHRMSRWLPIFMERYNCNFVFVNKQNDKVDMTNKRPGFAQPSPMKNDTRLGGRALKRVCAYRMTMMQLDDIKQKTGDKKVYGHNNRIMMVSNSYGPRSRTCEFSIYFDEHEDTPSYQAAGLTFDDRTAIWLAERKMLGVKVDKGLFTCDLVGCVAVSAAELMAALKNHPEHIEYVGAQLGIEGYSTSAMTSSDTEPGDAAEDTPEEKLM